LTEIARRLFGEHADQLRFIVELGKAAALPGARMQLAYSVDEHAFIVFCEMNKTYASYIGLPGEVIDPDGGRLLRERAALVTGALDKAWQAMAQEGASATVPLPAELIESVEPLIAALPDDAVLVDVLGTSYLVPPRNKQPLVSDEELAFDDCCVLEIKFPAEAKLQGTPRDGGRRRQLNVQVTEGSVAAARLFVAAFTGASFSMRAREIRDGSLVKFFPSEILTPDAVGKQVRTVMRQAQIEL
jgi:hypothetical protein